MARTNRLNRELKSLKESPPPGVSCWPEDENFCKLKAIIFADDESAYKGGTFELELEIPERYPFQPPKVRFITKIYHPNIDTAGRICLDILKMPPSGGWRPAHNISSLLTSVRLLMSSPNPDDPLMTDIAEEFKLNRTSFDATAQSWTNKYAMKQEHDNVEPTLKKADSRKRKCEDGD